MVQSKIETGMSRCRKSRHTCFFLPKGGKNVVILYNRKNNYNGIMGKYDGGLGLIRG